MASLDDLPQMIAENQQLRDDFISTLTEFCKRHGIEAVPEDFIGLAGGEDTQGQILNTGVQLPGPVAVLIYRDGPRYSRWIDSGVVAGPGPSLADR
jgi:hypothetical protein